MSSLWRCLRHCRHLGKQSNCCLQEVIRHGWRTILNNTAPRLHAFHAGVDHGWYCQFLEPDLKTSLPRKLTFKGSEKVLEMYDRFGTEKKLEDRAALEYGINQGRGS